VSVPGTMGFMHGAPRRERSAMAMARRTAKAIARRSTVAALQKHGRRVALQKGGTASTAVAALQKGGTASTAVAASSSGWRQVHRRVSAAIGAIGAIPSAVAVAPKAVALGAIPSAVAVDRSSRCGAQPKHMLRRAAPVPASSGRERVRFVPPLELFIIAGEFPGDKHRLPWNAMFVSIGEVFGKSSIKSRNDKGDFFVAGASSLGWIRGPQVGARASAVAELSTTGWLGSGAFVSAPRYCPEIWRRIYLDQSRTVGLAVHIVFAEDSAVAEFGASGASVVVVATSGCRLGDNTVHICQFISDVGADLVVMIDNGPLAGVTRSSPPAIASCAQEVSDWVVGCGMTADLEVLYADDILAVARIKHSGCRRFLFGLQREQQFEHRDNARNIKLCGG
jgi:hypothetical protein